MGIFLKSGGGGHWDIFPSPSSLGFLPMYAIEMVSQQINLSELRPRLNYTSFTQLSLLCMLYEIMDDAKVKLLTVNANNKFSHFKKLG